MKEVQEMKPVIVNVCKNQTETREVCESEMEKKMVMRKKPAKTCKMITEKPCYETVSLKKLNEMKKVCSFHPETMCHTSEGIGCRMAKKIHCNYIDTNPL